MDKEKFKEKCREIPFLAFRFAQGIPAETWRFLRHFYAYRKGRESRWTFWQGVVGLQLADAVLALCAVFAPTAPLVVFRILFTLVNYFAVFSASCRRMRDAGKPEWAPALVPFLAVVPSTFLGALSLALNLDNVAFQMKFALFCSLSAAVAWFVVFMWCTLPDKETQAERSKGKQSVTKAVFGALSRKFRGGSK